MSLPEGGVVGVPGVCGGEAAPLYGLTCPSAVPSFSPWEIARPSTPPPPSSPRSCRAPPSHCHAWGIGFSFSGGYRPRPAPQPQNVFPGCSHHSSFSASNLHLPAALCRRCELSPDGPGVSCRTLAQENSRAIRGPLERHPRGPFSESAEGFHDNGGLG